MTLDARERDPLARVRQEIESVDRTIVLLLAARLDAARRALQLRLARDHRLTDREQEGRVRERGREWAEELGVSPELVDHLFGALMEEGKARFRRSEGLEESAVVAVFVAPPKGTVVHRRRSPRLELETRLPPLSP